MIFASKLNIVWIIVSKRKKVTFLLAFFGDLNSFRFKMLIQYTLNHWLNIDVCLFDFRSEISYITLQVPHNASLLLRSLEYQLFGILFSSVPLSVYILYSVQT